MSILFLNSHLIVICKSLWFAQLISRVNSSFRKIEQCEQFKINIIFRKQLLNKNIVSLTTSAERIFGELCIYSD